jgi:hypothetical protein
LGDTAGLSQDDLGDTIGLVHDWKIYQAYQMTGRYSSLTARLSRKYCRLNA